jgi:hypothetical protein
MGLLASQLYFPVAPQGILYETSDPTRYVDVDPEHMSVTFEGPRSGRVLVSVQAAGGGGVGAIVTYWALRGTGGQGPDNVVPGSERYVYGEALVKQLLDCYQVILDVRPGTTYRWAFAFKPGNSYGTSIKIGHPTVDPAGHGPLLMEVWDTGPEP